MLRGYGTASVSLRIAAVLWIVIAMVASVSLTAASDSRADACYPSSACFVLEPLSVHAPISINGNSDFSAQALLEGWQGDGSPEDPYIIEGYEIDASSASNGISVGNTTVSFVVRDCALNGAGESGILMYNVDNGFISNNTCSSNTRYGICLVYSDGNRLENNTCSASYVGILLTYSNNNRVANNSLIDATGGMVIEACMDNAIVDNELLGTGKGIKVSVGLGSPMRNLIRGNNCSYRTGHGIHLYAPGVMSCNGNTVTDNICVHNALHGICMESEGGSVANTVLQNNCSYNTGSGIVQILSGGSRIENNTCIGNNEQGISLGVSSSCRINTNICIQNGGVGIRFNAIVQTFSGQAISNVCSMNGAGGMYFQGMWSEPSIRFAISWNNCSDNGGDGIVFLLAGANQIGNNTCSNNAGSGMVFAGSSNNVIVINNCSYNAADGICLDDRLGHELITSRKNEIRSNWFVGNEAFGVNISSGTANRVWSNSFLGNNGATETYDPLHTQAFSNMTGNFWNISGSGNYWSDWISPDLDLDGIVDDPYLIAGSGANMDYYPLAVAPEPIPEFGPAAFLVTVFSMALVVVISRRLSPRP